MATLRENAQAAFLRLPKKRQDAIQADWTRESVAIMEAASAAERTLKVFEVHHRMEAARNKHYERVVREAEKTYAP